MKKVLMIAADVHDENMLTKYVINRGAIGTKSFANRRKSWQAMVTFFKAVARQAGVARIVFVYEASGCGFTLHDFLQGEGIECYVLAPSKLKRAPRDRRTKTDEKDALGLLEELRGHVLAGNPLPAVTVPSLQLRDDREIVRARMELGQKITIVKTQVQTLLKRQGLEKPPGLSAGWSKLHRAWLRGLVASGGALALGARTGLCSLLRQLQALEEENERLDGVVAELGQTPRYREPVRALDTMCGVRVLTALVFLTEMGDVRRFANRREIGSYLGLVPTSNESGEANDRKGHITRHGSARLRRVLCQATWARIRHDPETRASYERLVSRNPKKKMIAVVACMRQLGIRMWHTAVRAARTA